MYNMETARILWVLSLFIPGLHRFYLGKWLSGLLYLFTGGFGLIGTFIDFFRLPKMVADANREIEYKKILYPGLGGPSPVIEKKKESIEKIILKTAKKNDGIVTSSEVALNGEISLDQAKEYLEKLAKKGFAEMRVKKNGVIVFCFPEFMQETRTSDFEDF
ncbi:MAG: TM2 domain-containing protein [Spirochaetales bacterium]|nr:TM2 domain-containing protein [Spirochaetales bacterium]